MFKIAGKIIFLSKNNNSYEELCFGPMEVKVNELAVLLTAGWTLNKTEILIVEVQE